MAFKKTFSYAGFEMQPKKYHNPKIALLNIELELKAEKDNAEIRVDNVKVKMFSLSGEMWAEKWRNIFMAIKWNLVPVNCIFIKAGLLISATQS